MKARRQSLIQYRRYLPPQQIVYFDYHRLRRGQSETELRGRVKRIRIVLIEAERCRYIGRPLVNPDQRPISKVQASWLRKTRLSG